MHIKELNIALFDAFASSSPISSHYESSRYAIFMGEQGYDYDLIGYVDELGVIKAATLILKKKIDLTHRYGYAPKGFLIDYFDYDLLKSFVQDLKEYYKNELSFIKINPEIAIGEIDINTKSVNYNQNIIIRDYLTELGFNKLKDNLYFEALFPRFNGIVNLKEYSFDNLSKNTKNKIRKAEKKGLIIEKTDRDGLDILYKFIKNKKKVNDNYYKNYYNTLGKEDQCDIFLIKIDYEKYLLNSKKLYDKELEINTELSNKLIENPNPNLISNKMNSDKTLLSYKNDIEIATHNLQTKKSEYIGGVLTLKYNNRINIIISGYNKAFKRFNPNYYLHYYLIEYYKNEYNFLDLNGLTGDFKKSNPYYGLNEFKLGFKPHVYEFIGEFDLIINDKVYNSLGKKGILAKEFNKKEN